MTCRLISNPLSSIHRQRRLSTAIVLSAAIFTLLLVFHGQASAAPSAEEIIQRCDIEIQGGKAKRSRMTVILRDAGGN